MASIGSEQSPLMSIVGTQQSPIRIDTAEAIPAVFGPDYLQFGYSRPLSGVYSDYNFLFDLPAKKADPAWSITVRDRIWMLRKIHIHNPAEHLIDRNSPAPYECHLVHSAPDDPGANGDKLVIGVFLRLHRQAPSRPTIRKLNEKLREAGSKPDGENGEKWGELRDTHKLDPREFLPEEGQRAHWFRYQGSLTSSPFSEDVTWFVMRTEIGIPPDDFREFGDRASQMAREVYPLNRRFVVRNHA
jgi:carbonic anhydrase